MTAANVELTIEELVLHGFAADDRHTIGASVERELGRLFAEHGVPATLAQGGDLMRLDGGSFLVAPDSRVEGIGAQVARSVYRGFGR
jgi:hypothetical protein